MGVGIVLHTMPALFIALITGQSSRTVAGPPGGGGRTVNLVSLKRVKLSG